LEHLPEVIAESLGLHENKVLDSNALEVQRLLERRGISVPASLHPMEYASSVYHHHERYSSYGKTTDIYDKLWALGFRDTNSFDEKGCLPLMDLNFESIYNTTRWLIEHGADYWTPLSERSDSTKITVSVTPSHFVLAKIGLYLSRNKTTDVKWLLEKLLQTRVNDTCSCQCSMDGCTPLKAYFDRKNRYYKGHHPLSQELTSNLVTFIHTFQPCFNEEHVVVVAVRYLTFHALGLTHTCCSFIQGPTSYKGPRYTPEEIDEIYSEERASRTLFADLIIEFERTAYEDQNGIPLIVTDAEEFWIRR
jgi:hypothetical protein